MGALSTMQKEAVAVCYNDITRLFAGLDWLVNAEGYEALLERVLISAKMHDGVDRTAFLKMAEIVKLYRDDNTDRTGGRDGQ
jgi:hypothetical protein